MGHSAVGRAPDAVEVVRQEFAFEQVKRRLVAEKGNFFDANCINDALRDMLTGITLRACIQLTVTEEW